MGHYPPTTVRLYASTPAVRWDWELSSDRPPLAGGGSSMVVLSLLGVDQVLAVLRSQ